MHEFVHHTPKDYARGDVHANRAECLLSLLQPYLRVFRGVSQFSRPGDIGCFQFLRTFVSLMPLSRRSQCCRRH